MDISQTPAPETTAFEAFEDLRRDVRTGLDQLDRGLGAPWDVEAVKARVREQVARAREAR